MGDKASHPREAGRFVPGHRYSPETMIAPGERMSPQTEFRSGERRGQGTEFRPGVRAPNHLPGIRGVYTDPDALPMRALVALIPAVGSRVPAVTTSEVAALDEARRKRSGA